MELISIFSASRNGICFLFALLVKGFLFTKHIPLLINIELITQKRKRVDFSLAPFKKTLCTPLVPGAFSVFATWQHITFLME